MKPVNEQSYYNDRRDRLADILTEYMTDGSVSSHDIYHDIMGELNETS